MSSSLRVFLGVCLLVLLLVGSVFLFRSDLFQAGEAGDDQAPPQRPAAVVAVAQPVQTQLPVQVLADGEVTAWQEASVASETNALTLSAVLVNVGDTVKRGDVLARFNGKTVAADVTQARAALAEAQAAATEAEANVRRARRLRGTDTLSAQQIEQYLAAGRTARARVRSAQAALASKQQNWQNVELRAPDDGVISSRTATVGSVPAAGTELFRLIRQGRLEWQAELGARDVQRVKPGGPVAVYAADGTPVPGVMCARAPSEDTKKRTTLVYVDVPASPGLWAGMFARGAFDLGRSPALTVPMEALVPSDGFMYVYRLKTDGHRGSADDRRDMAPGHRAGEGTGAASGHAESGHPAAGQGAATDRSSASAAFVLVERVRVKTGRQDGDRIEILSDESAGAPDASAAQNGQGQRPASLSARDQVVVSGAAFLTDGDLVKVVDLPAARGDALDDPATGNPAAKDGAESLPASGILNREEITATGTTAKGSTAKGAGAEATE